MITAPSTIQQNTETGMIELTLQVSVDGRTWRPQTFDGESSCYVDTLAATFVQECGANLEVAFDQETDWSLFPRTFDAMFSLALSRTEINAVPA